MKVIAKAVVEAGLVPSESLDELARWGVHINVEPQEGFHDAEDVVSHIREAYEGSGQVSLDETDLDMLRRYLDKDHQKCGRLVLREGVKHRSLAVRFCLTCLGEYAIPWVDEESPSILVNGHTHLRWDDGGVQRDVKFSDYRELFYGAKKAFVVCTPMGSTDE
jgi:hypothetical protein